MLQVATLPLIASLFPQWKESSLTQWEIATTSLWVLSSLTDEHLHINELASRSMLEAFHNLPQAQNLFLCGIKYQRFLRNIQVEVIPYKW